jgi:RNA polymerase sigma factor (sigma-70 family)
MRDLRTSATLTGQIGTLYSLGALGSMPDDQLVDVFLARVDAAASEAAFAALVDRHGAMVLNVCQRVLQNPHDAHDAFQATFLVLVRKAETIRRRESVGGWLFGIARRVAVRARLEAARRRRRLEKMGIERQSAHEDEKAFTCEPEADYGPLIEAIDRLPERFRAPVVLHYFEGLSADATAERLGCPRGTVLSRLARARERIRRRLERRGMSVESLMSAVSGPVRLISSPTVPSSLAEQTVRAASCLALAGMAIETVVPATVANLSRSVVRNLMLAKARVPSMLVILGLASAAIGLSMGAPADDKFGVVGAQPKKASRPATGSENTDAPQPNKADLGATVTIHGHVLDPTGKPVAGAKIVLGLPATGPGDFRPPRHLTFSDAGGRFEVAIATEMLSVAGPDRTARPAIAAIASGLGPDWIHVDAASAGNVLTLRLRQDDAPIEGRVIGLEGKPSAGSIVYPAAIMDFPNELLKKLGENAGKMNPDLWGEMRNALVMGKDGPISPVRTGSDGRFHLKGIGRDRGATLIIEGDSHELSFAMIFTSSDPAYSPLLLPSDGSGERRLFGCRFDLTVAPGRLIEGVIRDIDSGRPVGGAKVRSWSFGTATSDADGRFKIPGQPKGPLNQIEITVDDQPFIKVEKPVGDPSGLGPIHVDIALKRGVLVEGRVRSRMDGRPVKAIVQYYPLRDNPHLKECPDASFLDNNVSDEAEFVTDADGRFRAVALPGAGILTVRTIGRDFLSAKPLADQDAGKVLHAANFGMMMTQFQALVPINPRDVATIAIPDIIVDQGRSQHLKVAGPDGKPVTGLRLFGSLINSLGGDPLSGAELTFVHPEPGKELAILVVDRDETAGRLVVVKGDEPDPISISLQPAGRVIGRLVDDEGRPRPNVPFAVALVLQSIQRERFSVQPPTGPDGRFEIKGLIPGVTYNVAAVKNDTRDSLERMLGSIGKTQWTVKPGETQDWGNVQVKKYGPP